MTSIRAAGYTSHGKPGTAGGLNQFGVAQGPAPDLDVKKNTTPEDIAKDKEKEKGVAVLPMFDRDANNELAKGQIGFINFICIKYFSSIAKAFKTLQWTIDNVQSNLDTWKSQVN